MKSQQGRSEIPYVAVIDNVGEISLQGTADYSFWHARLKGEGLVPVQEQGKAKLLISATIAKYNGVRFRELCFLVEATAEVNGGHAVGCYMPHAFNSVRLYAWIERTFFSCPYYPADVRAATAPQITMAMREKGQTYFEASLLGDQRPVKECDDGWQGPIFVPTNRRAQFFYAKLSGKTESYPCGPGDRIAIKPHPRWPIFDCLAESGFVGREWSVRRNAVHAKSKSLDRNQCPVAFG